MIADKLIVFDLETGGLELHHPIIQIAAVAISTRNGWAESESFEVKLKFDPETADAEALELNSYDPAVWEAEAVEPQVAALRFTRFLERYRCVECISKRGKPYYVAQLCGHNAAGFDGPRIRHLYGETLRPPNAEYGPFLPAHMFVLDTWQLAAWYFQIGNLPAPANFKLSTLCEYFEIPLGDSAHDALADVRSTAALVKVIVDDIKRGDQ